LPTTWVPIAALEFERITDGRFNLTYRVTDSAEG
jgi:hypothetical protein